MHRARSPGRDGKAFLSVPWRTLAGLAGEPGMLSRVGPVTAQVAREIAVAAAAEAGCEWRAIVVGPAGRAIAVVTVPRTWPVRRGRTNLAAGGPVAGSPAAGGPAAGSPVAGGSVAGGPASDGPGGTPSGGGLVARVTLTVPEALLFDDEASSAARLAAGAGSEAESAAWACPAGLCPVLTAALRAAGRALRRYRTGGTGHCECGHHQPVAGYRIPDSLRALVEARDQTCRFATCRQPAWLSDLDHTQPYHRGGPTCRCNLSAACRHHHRLKQLPAWQLTQPSPGLLIWRTPAGLTYTTAPEPHYC